MVYFRSTRVVQRSIRGLFCVAVAFFAVNCGNSDSSPDTRASAAGGNAGGGEQGTAGSGGGEGGAAGENVAGAAGQGGTIAMTMDAGVVVSKDAGVVSVDAATPRPLSALVGETIIWNGDGVGNGGGTQWMGRGQEGKTTLGYSTEQSFSSSHAVKFTMQNINYAEFGWGVRATPANRAPKIGFWVNMIPDAGKTAPGNALITLKVGGNYAAPGGGRGVETIKYNKTALRGGWNQVVIPIADVVGTPSSANITEILVGFAGCANPNCSFRFYLDDIAVGQ
jgi:hypothetical protein